VKITVYLVKGIDRPIALNCLKMLSHLMNAGEPHNASTLREN